jgi:hypothetical protein
MTKLSVHSIALIVFATLTSSVVVVSSFSPGLPSCHHHHQQQQQQQRTNINLNALDNNSLNENEEGLSSSRRKFFQTTAPILAAAAAALTSNPSLALAKDDETVELPSREQVTAAFDAIRYELSDPKGGVAYMQQRIDAQDFAGLMEFTKGYDLEMRKARMGKAKKLIQSKEIKEQATSYANAVTFDLIGMNRSSRKGQESVEGANKYLEELRSDVGKFLELEKTIQVQ